jgi:hypothetical protein
VRRAGRRASATCRRRRSPWATVRSARGLALNKVGDKSIGSNAETIGTAGGIGLLVILALAYFCGGYVAGRMARFDGARQGIGVWLWGLIAAAAAQRIAVSQCMS